MTSPFAIQHGEEGLLLWIFASSLPLIYASGIESNCASHVLRVTPTLSVLFGQVFICHGYAEHLARYEHVAMYLNNAGFTVFAIDHQGTDR